MEFIYPNLSLGVTTFDETKKELSYLKSPKEGIVGKPLKTSQVKFDEMKAKNSKALSDKANIVVAESTDSKEVTAPVVEDDDEGSEGGAAVLKRDEEVVAPVEATSVEVEPVTTSPIVEVANEAKEEPVVENAPIDETKSDDMGFGFNIGVEPPVTDDAEVSTSGIEIPALKFTTMAGEPLNTIGDWQRAYEKADPKYKSTKVLAATLNSLEASQYRLDQIEVEILDIQNDVEKLTMLINQLGEEARAIYSILTSCPKSALEERANPNGGQFLSIANSMVNDARLNFEVAIPGALKKCQDLIDTLKDERKIKADRIIELKSEAQEILAEMRKIINEAKQDYYDMKKIDDEATKARDIEAKYSMGPTESSINDEKVEGYKFSDPNIEKSVLDYLKNQDVEEKKERPMSLLNDNHYSDINFDEYLNRAKRVA